MYGVFSFCFDLGWFFCCFWFFFVIIFKLYVVGRQQNIHNSTNLGSDF